MQKYRRPSSMGGVGAVDVIEVIVSEIPDWSRFFFLKNVSRFCTFHVSFTIFRKAFTCFCPEALHTDRDLDTSTMDDSLQARCRL